MIGALSSFVELFAAVYITMAVNNDFFSQFWSPRYYKEMEGILAKYDIKWSTPMRESLSKEIFLQNEKIKNIAHYKGAILLCLCVAYLILMGFEDDKNVTTFHISMVYCSMFVVITLLFSNCLLRSWRWVSGVIFFLLIITCLPLVFNWTFKTDNAFINLAIVYQKYLLISVILAPAFHQVYLNWLFSSIYKGYLKNKVREEYNKYNSSLKGIETKNRSLVDPIYLDKWTDNQFSNVDDDSVTGYNEVLYAQLINAASPSQFCLLKSWIRYYLFKLFEREKASPNTKEQTQRSSILKYKDDFSREYSEYVSWKIAKGNNGLRRFCSERGIDAGAMIGWVKKNKPKQD